MSATVEKSYMGLRGKWLNIAISTIATTGFLLFGYDQGVVCIDEYYVKDIETDIFPDERYHFS